MQPSSRSSVTTGHVPQNWQAAATLFVLAPVMGEVVGASLRLSYFVEPLRILGIVCFYGAGVVLIREIAQRLNLTRWGLVMLGCAFAVIEEGLALQTIFNPIGMDGEPVHGNALGVNWFWAVVVTGYHVVWSVLIPIVVVHLAFSRSRRSPWLSWPAAGAFAALFAFGTATFLAVSYLRSDFRLSWGQGATTIVVAAGLVWAGTKCRDHEEIERAAPAPGHVFVGLFGLVAGVCWFVLFLAAFIGGPVSFVWWTAAGLFLAAAVSLVLRYWTRRTRTPRHEFALCFGAGMAAALFGLLLVAIDGHRANTAFQCGLIVAFSAAYIWLDRRLRSPSV